MADYYSTLIVQPFIPKHLLWTEDLALFAAFGLTVSHHTEETLYVRCNYYNGTGCISEGGGEIDLDHDDFVARLQAMLKRIDSDELRWISLETTYSCSEVRPEGFGAAVTFITKNNLDYLSTSSWQEERIHEVEPDDSGPLTDGLIEPLPILAVVIEGGLVQTICSDQPEKFAGIDVVVIDYDTDGSDDLTPVPQGNGTDPVDACVSLWHTEKAGIELQEVVQAIKIEKGESHGA